MPGPEASPGIPHQYRIDLLREHFGVLASVEGDTVTLMRDEVNRVRNFSVQKLLLDTIEAIQSHYRVVYKD